MLKNRSVPADILLPHVVYENVDAAAAWLNRVFGFEEHYRYGGAGKDTRGVQVHLGDAWIMLTRPRGRWVSPAQTGQGTQSLTVFVKDVEKHLERAKAEGAQIVEKLHVTEYGELQYGVVDFEGHHWLFARHTQDVEPSEWGARVAEPGNT
jgi:uncharacterized glyoxalase superfamily protein PhnB